MLAMFSGCMRFMFDTIRLQLPIKSEFIQFFEDKDGIYSGADICPKVLHSYGFKLAAGEVEIDSEGVTEVHGLHCPYQSLPSSNSSLAYKLFKGGRNYFPFIELNASGAKLLQGHNVFGSDDLEVCAQALLYCFTEQFPAVLQLIDVPLIEVSQLDVTYSAKVQNYFVAKQVINALKHVSTGQIKVSKGYETTSMWNAGSTHCVREAYLKGVEVKRQIEEVEKKLKTNKAEYLQRQLIALTNPLVQEMADNAVRFEAKIKKKWLQKRGFSTLLSDLIHKSKNTDNFAQLLWQDAWKPIFKTFEGADVNIYDDDAVLKKLKCEYFTETQKGFSYNKAKRLFRFFRSLKSEGYENVLDSMPRATFFRSMSELTAVIAKSALQNLTAKNTDNVIPLIRVINVDFAEQLPKNWVEPKPMYLQLRAV
jgi:II/X family phage/plasmid replication protein